MMMMSLSEALAPTTSSGVAFWPSGITWGVGLSMDAILKGGDGGPLINGRTMPNRFVKTRIFGGCIYTM